MKKSFIFLLLFCFSIHAMDSDKKNSNGELWIAISHEQYEPIQKKCLSINQQKLDHELFIKIYDKDSEAVQELIDDGANVNVRYGLYEFSFFNFLNRPLAIGYFMYFQACLSAFCSPLHAAIEKNNIEIADILLRAGANPNIRNNYKQTPLHRAVSLENIAMVKLLLAYGANPNVLDYGLESPLYKAAASYDEQVDIVKELVLAGADIDQLDSCGTLARDRAAASSHWNVHTFLQDFDEYTLEFLKKGDLKIITKSGSTISFARQDFAKCLYGGNTNWLSLVRVLNSMSNDSDAYKNAQQLIKRDVFHACKSKKVKKNLRDKELVIISEEIGFMCTLKKSLKKGPFSDIIIK